LLEMSSTEEKTEERTREFLCCCSHNRFWTLFNS
jgi:hypothetical protein